MATVKEKTNLAKHLLDYLESMWQELEERNHLWNELPEDDKVDFLADWPIVEDNLFHLQKMIESNDLTPDQLQRYSRLQERIAKDRTILESLWERP